MLNSVILVAAGGFLGAAARYLLGRFVGLYWKRNLPLGTFIINITGSFLLGLITFHPVLSAALSRDVRMGLGIGFLGSFTTFSTLEYETLVLLEEGKSTTAILYVLGSFMLGFAAAWVCLWL